MSLSCLQRTKNLVIFGVPISNRFDFVPIIGLRWRIRWNHMIWWFMIINIYIYIMDICHDEFLYYVTVLVVISSLSWRDKFLTHNHTHTPWLPGVLATGIHEIMKPLNWNLIEKHGFFGRGCLSQEPRFEAYKTLVLDLDETLVSRAWRSFSLVLWWSSLLVFDVEAWISFCFRHL